LKRCYVDANVLVKAVIERDTSLFERLIGYELFTSVLTLEEAMYKVIALTVMEVEGRRLGAFSVKEKYRKKVAKDLIEARIKALNEIVSRITVLSPTKEDFEYAKEIASEYKLLPNDALIVAVMRRRGIDEIATFDEDFRRVSGLNVVR